MSIRCFRLLLLCAHIARGLFLVRFVYPRRTHRAQRMMLRRWSRQLLGILRIRRHRGRGGDAVPNSCIIVANHVSWLDIFVINACFPARFVAKAEIRRWPAIGRLCVSTGTLFIERVKRRDAHRINEKIAGALAEGDRVALFPEGTTTHGDMVRPFHANLLQAAVVGAAPVQPVALRYLQADGSLCRAASYVGDQSLIACVLAILAQPVIVAEVMVLAALPHDGQTRRDLARATEAAIAGRLGLPVAHRSSARPRDPQA